jgi:hypothetical protein
MSHKTRMTPKAMRNFVICSAFAAVLLAGGCSTNGGGGTVTIVDSQPPDSQTTDFGIAYVKRTVPPQTTQDDLRLRRVFFASADLYILNPTNNGGNEVNITSRITSTAPKGTFYDVKDVDISADGTNIIFAMRGPVTAKQMDLKPPNWNLYQYTIAQDLLQKIVPQSDPDGTGAQYISPHYLPDGRILFATTRQIGSGAVLLNEGKPEFEEQTEDQTESSFVLHVMNPDGSGLHQITYNQSHDVDATVLNSGRVLWSRWDDANGVNFIHLYTANPDGTDVELLYGKGSHNTVTTNPGSANTCPAGIDCTIHFARPREMENGKILALVRNFTNTDFGGDLEIIDAQNFVENNQPYPSAIANAGASTTTFAQTSATQNAVDLGVNDTTNVPDISVGGRFSSGVPLWDGTGRILVTWSECRLQNAAKAILPCTPSNLAMTVPAAAGAAPVLTAAPILYSLWMFNPGDNTFKPVVVPTEGVFLTDVVALQPRPAAQQYIPDSYDSTTAPVAVLDIKSVYDWDGATWNGLPAGGIAAIAQTEADQRPARFLRLEKAVSLPNKQTLNFDKQTAFGVAGNYMREILGYVPIEPDGSVRVQVPANVAFQISITDATGKRLFPLHRAWLQLLPGEVLTCNGCHEPQSQQMPAAGTSFYSHGRVGNLANQPAPTVQIQPTFAAVWAGASGTAPFPGTVAGSPASTIAPCAGETMAEALVGYNCGNSANSATAAATPSVNPVFIDPWFGGGTGNEPITDLSYSDPAYLGPIPTVSGGSPSIACSLESATSYPPTSGWTPYCRVVISYDCPVANTACQAATGATTSPFGNIQPLWSATRALGGVAGAGTCNSAGCHTGGAAKAAGHLDLSTAASAANANQDESYRELFCLDDNVCSSTTVNAGGQAVTTTFRGAEFISGDALDSHFFQVFATDSMHVGLLSPAELRMLTEWVDIGAQYYNNPFIAPLAN